LCYKAFLRGIIIVNLAELGILALIEGVADIVPVDSSAHSMIAARLLSLRAGGLLAAIQLGAALALSLYFWRDIGLIGSGLWKLRKARIEAGTRLLSKMLVAALPFLLIEGGVGGIVLPKLVSIFWIGVITVLCALIMAFADRLSLTVKRIEHIGVLTCLAVGLAQIAAVIAGIGRVPAALIMARLFGMERTAAYRFVLLASVPILLVGAVCGLVDSGRHPGLSDGLALCLTFLLSLLALPVAFSLIRRAGLLPFALYRLLFGLILIGLGLL
jgi:undecaprenyl-diphosphatase